MRPSAIRAWRFPFYHTALALSLYLSRFQVHWRPKSGETMPVHAEVGNSWRGSKVSIHQALEASCRISDVPSRRSINGFVDSCAKSCESNGENPRPVVESLLHWDLRRNGHARQRQPTLGPGGMLGSRICTRRSTTACLPHGDFGAFSINTGPCSSPHEPPCTYPYVRWGGWDGKGDLPSHPIHYDRTSGISKFSATRIIMAKATGTAPIGDSAAPGIPTRYQT